MPSITKTVDKTTVNGNETFVYTFNVSYSGLAQPATNGRLDDVFASIVEYTLPAIGGNIVNITESPVSGGTLVEFDFGPVDTNTAFSFTVTCQFGPGRKNGSSFINACDLFADQTLLVSTSAPAVTLTLEDDFQIVKYIDSPLAISPGDTFEYTILLLNFDNQIGYEITNVDFTDTLPPQLVPDLSFTPVGEDVPYLGYSDPTYNGKTGSWTGNTMNFNLPSFSGARYTIKFRAKVLDNVTPDTFIINQAKWTVNGVTRNPANHQFKVAYVGKIGNFVFVDENENGIFDIGEPGINGVTVELYDATGLILLKTTITANDGLGNPGYYLFDDLLPGTYFVKFIPPSGRQLTIQNLSIKGSKPNQMTGLTLPIILLPQQVNNDIIAGILPICLPPVITVTPYCVPQYSVYNPLKGVTATDCQGQDITQDIIVTENTVNTEVPGIYSVTYQVSDSIGQTTTKTVPVRVCAVGPYDQAITDLIESVALEETALSHILNAEGEKIQQALATAGLTPNQLLEVNRSVTCMVKSVTQLEIILHSKLQIFHQNICQE